MGGPILITYSKDVTGNMGEADTDAKLNMTMLTISHIFDGTITFCDDVRITGTSAVRDKYCISPQIDSHSHTQIMI